VARKQKGSESASSSDHGGVQQMLWHPQAVPDGLWQGVQGLGEPLPHTIRDL